MKVTLSLPGCHPFSINKAYYKRTFTRTQKCRDWGLTIEAALRTPQNQLAISAFKAAYFKQREAGILVDIVFEIPKSHFMTKTGEISRRSQDLSNVEKMLIDILFDERYNFNNLGIDDKNIVKLESEKRKSETWKITINLKIIEGVL